MTQYNVLRILRGAPDGLSCGEIGSRMIRRSRHLVVRITSAGMEMVGRRDEPVLAVHREQLGHLGEKRLRELSELLTACRDRLE